jgi:hypothetical protein
MTVGCLTTFTPKGLEDVPVQYATRISMLYPQALIPVQSQKDIESFTEMLNPKKEAAKTVLRRCMLPRFLPSYSLE